jgi:hypothetical protein
MPKIHYFQRYSSIENTVTNNTLQLIARIFTYSNARASKLLSDIIGEPIEIGIEINQQERAGNAVPDGTIIQRSFKILVESKVKAPVDEDQLVRHSKAFSNEEQKILLLLTVNEIDQAAKNRLTERITKAQPGTIFRNVTYETICGALHGLFQDYETDMQALVEDYVEYCNDTRLFDQSRYLMRIVPCGVSVDLNRKYGIYFQPSDRKYTKHSYVGVYNLLQVKCLWRIDSVFDIDFDGQNLSKTRVQGRSTDEYDNKIKEMIAEAKAVCGFNVESGHRFFCGKRAIDTDYKKLSAGGIWGARLVNLKEVVGSFDSETDLAEKLRAKSWK